MNRTLSSAEHDTSAERGHEHDVRLDEIGRLIGQCQSRMEGVSSGILSSATRTATMEMYRDLQKEAETNASLREERLSWMQNNVTLLQETIVKATLERERFKSDLSEAVANHWIGASDVAAWMDEFDNPNLLEMYRSQWMKETWEKKYKAGWRKLEKDRADVLAFAAKQGLTAAEIPDLAILKDNALFLAKDTKFPKRRSLVDAVEAKIIEIGAGRPQILHGIEAMLEPASKGKNRYLHPAKLGAWLKKIAQDPIRYTPETVAAYMKEWKAARTQFDDLSRRYVEEDRPDGCAPTSINAFLELPYETRVVTLNEWQHRLDAAKRLQHLDEADALEHAKRSIRRSVDLKDYDAAERELAMLQRKHSEDADVRSIAAHLGAVRAHEEAQEKRSDEERTNDALEGLAEVRKGVPAAVAAHYEHILESGDPEKAATFFRAMKLRGERRLQGETTDDEERAITETAELIDQAVLLDGTEDNDMAQVVVTEETSPTVTMTLLSEQRNGRPPALVIEGVSFAQQLQLVQINERVLANMRHLESVGKRRADDTEAVAA